MVYAFPLLMPCGGSTGGICNLKFRMGYWWTNKEYIFDTFAADELGKIIVEKLANWIDNIVDSDPKSFHDIFRTIFGNTFVIPGIPRRL